jgi:histidine triad (HIT) family protein
MTNPDCLFCKILSGTIPARVIDQDEKTFSFLDIGPVTRGHFLIIPKNHADALSLGTSEDAQALIATAHRLAPKVLKALGATGYNLGLNHGISGGQDVFHTHLHFMPRYDGQPRTFVKMTPTKEEQGEVYRLLTE